MSVSARSLQVVRREPLPAVPARTSSRARDSLIANGSSDSGLNASLTCSYGTSCDEPQNSQRWPTRSGSNTEIAWQLWHLTETFAVCHPRFASGMSRSAAARSCSTMTVSAPRVCSVAGDSVPQNGQTSACFAGVPVRLGAARRALELLRARSRTALSGGPGYPRNSRSAAFVIRHCVPIFFPFEIARLEARDHVGLGDAERLRGVGRRHQLGQTAPPAAAGAAAAGVACAAMPPG